MYNYLKLGFAATELIKCVQEVKKKSNLSNPAKGNFCLAQISTQKFGVSEVSKCSTKLFTNVDFE